jgi:hypothetical protein
MVVDASITSSTPARQYRIDVVWIGGTSPRETIYTSRYLSAAIAERERLTRSEDPMSGRVYCVTDDGGNAIESFDNYNDMW